VLEPTQLFAWACVRCGDVGLFQAPGEDRTPRPDAPPPAPRPVDASPEVLAWVAAFPRLVSLHPDRVGYVPAGFRVDDADAAQAAASAAVADQASLTVLERLRAAGLPTAPPPPDLPAALASFTDVQEAAAAADRGDVDELVALTARFSVGRPATSPTRRVVEDAVVVTPGAVEHVVAGIRHPDAGRRHQSLTASIALAPLVPTLVDPLLDVLRDPVDPDPAGDDLRLAAAALAGFDDRLLAPHVEVFDGLAHRARRGAWFRLDRDARARCGYLREAAERLTARAGAR